MKARLLRWLNHIAYPTYECRYCIGQEWHQGCWCAYYGAVAPGVGPSKFRLWLQGWANRLSENGDAEHV